MMVCMAKELGTLLITTFSADDGLTAESWRWNSWHPNVMDIYPALDGNPTFWEIVFTALMIHMEMNYG